MTPRERVRAAFSGEETDRVPIYCAGMHGRIASHVLGREAYVGFGIQRWRESLALWRGEDAHAEFIERTHHDVMEVNEVLDFDLVFVGHGRYPVRPTRIIDERTFLYGDEDERWWVMRYDPDTELFQRVDGSPVPEPTMEDLERAVESAERSAEEYQPTADDFPAQQYALEYFGDEREIFGAGIMVAVPRERAWLEAMLLRPEVVRRYTMAQAKRATRNAAVMGEMGLWVIFGGGDFAGKNGPLYSPQSFRECMTPAVREVSRGCHRAGVLHMFASDGDLWPVADELFGNCGVDGYHEIDRRAGMDLERLRDRFPHLRLMGGIACETLHLGTPDEVREECLSALEVARRRGRIMVGVSNTVVAPTPFENFDAMVETLHRHR
ncbi:MAG: uroporphyrinogen decarboxylase family protein [Armatimonadota bacterium]|nr:uroporphyrinogen decarboxylase family protein [Armatimonadota bacterium]